jgi:hypothetical protein
MDEFLVQEKAAPVYSVTLVIGNRLVKFQGNHLVQISRCIRQNAKKIIAYKDFHVALFCKERGRVREDEYFKIASLFYHNGISHVNGGKLRPSDLAFIKKPECKMKQLQNKYAPKVKGLWGSP